MDQWRELETFKDGLQSLLSIETPKIGISEVKSW